MVTYNNEVIMFDYDDHYLREINAQDAELIDQFYQDPALISYGEWYDTIDDYSQPPIK